VALEIPDRAVRTGIGDARQVIVRGQGGWRYPASANVRGGFSERPSPLVDLAQRVVAVFFLGEKPTGGHTVEISRIPLRDDRLVVRVGVAQRAPDGVVVYVLTEPFHSAKVAHADVPRLVPDLGAVALGGLAGTAAGAAEIPYTGRGLPWLWTLGPLPVSRRGVSLRRVSLRWYRAGASRTRRGSSVYSAMGHGGRGGRTNAQGEGNPDPARRDGDHLDWAPCQQAPWRRRSRG